MKVLAATLLAAGLSLSTSSHSAAIDFIDNGYYTTDTISGLDWLDITETTNKSLNYVTSQLGTGGAYEGWRYATGAEVLTMTHNYTEFNYVVIGTSYHAPTDAFTGLLDLIGTTTTNTSLKSETLRGLIADINLDNGLHYTSKIQNYTFSAHANSFVAPYSSTASSDLVFSRLGSFLVRDNGVAISAVPIPAAVLLFAPALLGFLGVRHKRRAQSFLALGCTSTYCI
jgi:hypothetical protein